MRFFLAAIGCLLITLFGCQSPKPSDTTTTTHSSEAVEVPGYRSDGSVLLPNQWSLRPVGTQIAVGDFPENIAVHPSGDFAAVLHCGYGQHEIVVISLKSKSISSRIPIQEAFYGIAFTQDGNHVIASGGSREELHWIQFHDGFLQNHETIPLRDVKEKAIPSGVAVDARGKQAFVANANINAVSVFDVSEIGKSRSLGFIPVGWYPTSVRITPNGKQLIVANGKGESSRSNRHGPQPGGRSGQPLFVLAAHRNFCGGG